MRQSILSRLLVTTTALFAAAGCASHRSAGRAPTVSAEQVRTDLGTKVPEAITAWVATDPSIPTMPDPAFEQLLQRQRTVLEATDLSTQQIDQFFDHLRQMRRERIAHGSPAEPSHAPGSGG